LRMPSAIREISLSLLLLNNFTVTPSRRENTLSNQVFKKIMVVQN